MLGNGIDIEVAGQELKLLSDVLRAIRNNWKLLLLASVSGLVLGFVASYLKQEKFDATAQVMINTQISVETNFTPVDSGQPISTTALESEIEVMRSLDLVEKVVDQFDLVNDPEFNPDASGNDENDSPAADTPEPDTETTEQVAPAKLPFDAVRETIIANVAENRTIAQTGNVSAVYAITFTSADPQKAAVLANALAREYIAASREARVQSLELSQNWLQERTEDLKLRLSTLSVQRESFLLSAPYSPEEVETIKARNVSDSRSISAATLELNTIGTNTRLLQNLLDQENILDQASAARLLIPQIDQLLDSAASNPQQASDEIRAQISQKVEQLERQASALEGEIAALKVKIDDSRTVLVAQAGSDAELSRIENDIAVAEAIYQDFVSQLSRRTQQDRFLDDEARVISAARPALEPTSPNRRLYAIVAAVLATLLAFIKVVVSEIRQTKMRTPYEFEATTHLELLGVIPEIVDLPSQRDSVYISEKKLNPMLLSFGRKLRVSILAHARSMRHQRPTPSGQPWPQVIAGCAALPDEGSSTAMIAMAVAFSEAREKVLFIEFSGENNEKSNFAASRIGQPSLPSKHNGISTLKVKLSDIEDEEAKTIFELEEMLPILRESFDRIVVDLPPLLSHIGSIQICQSADETVIVGRWNHTSKNQIRSAIQALMSAGIQPLGVIASRYDLAGAGGFGDQTIYYVNPRQAVS